MDGAPEDICPLLLALLLSLSLSFHLITPSSLPHRTRTHPRSRSTPRRCGVTGWWPHRCPRVRVWPPAPAAPPLSAAECLKGAEGDESVRKQDSLGHFGREMMYFWTGSGIFPPFLMASNRTLRASLMGGRLAGWCLFVPMS